MLYGIIKSFGFCIFKIFFNFKIIGAEKIPKGNGLVLASNHASLLDPPLIGVASSRKVHFMAKNELFENPFLNILFRKLGAFPVRRGESDRAAIKHGISILKNKEVLAIFPEGTRNKTDQVRKPEAGALMMANVASATIVPVAVVGTKKVKLFKTIKVVFGEPIYLDQSKKLKKEDLAELSQELMEKIQFMLDSNR